MSVKSAFNRTVTTYAVLHFNQKEIMCDYDNHTPTDETVNIADIGLKSAADVHEYVRQNKRYEAYETYQVSVIKADGIDHTSKHYNETPKIWFGRVQAAEDMQVVKFTRDASGKPVEGREKLTTAQPGTKGQHFVRTEGYTIQRLEPGDTVFDKATNKHIWPLTKLSAKPKP